jgi:hypothetical protein
MPILRDVYGWQDYVKTVELTPQLLDDVLEGWELETLEHEKLLDGFEKRIEDLRGEIHTLNVVLEDCQEELDDLQADQPPTH